MAQGPPRVKSPRCVYSFSLAEHSASCAVVPPEQPAVPDYLQH